MMDMKAPVSLSNTRAPKVESPPKADTNRQSEPSEFDRHLSQQMDKTEPTTTSISNKEYVNQSLKSKVDMHQDGKAVAEAEASIISDESEIDELLLQAGTTVWENEPVDIIETIAEEVDVSALIIQTEQQRLPPAGNVLPQALQAENTVIKASELKINVNNGAAQPLTDSNKQPGLAEVLLESADETPELVEFKVEAKTQQSSNSQPGRNGLNLATLAAVASIQQHVPQTTTSSGINMHTVIPTEGMSNAPSLNNVISANVQSPNWSQGLTEKVSWMLQGNMQSAELKLNPAHLGPLEVKLSIQDDKASITFITAHGPVKEALDNAMPRLREMLEQQGVDLVDVDVSQYSDAKDEQDGRYGQKADVNEAAQHELDQQNAVINESVINISADQGVSIFV